QTRNRTRNRVAAGAAGNSRAAQVVRVIHAIVQDRHLDNVTISSAVDRLEFVSWYRRNRQRSRALFDVLVDEAYYAQPIALRHPIVFYEGHLPAFSFNTLVKRALGGSSIDAALEQLFARGIDPSETTPGSLETRDGWPSRDIVRDFVAEADRRVL